MNPGYLLGKGLSLTKVLRQDPGGAGCPRTGSAGKAFICGGLLAWQKELCPLARGNRGDLRLSVALKLDQRVTLSSLGPGYLLGG